LSNMAPRIERISFRKGAVKSLRMGFARLLDIRGTLSEVSTLTEAEAMAAGWRDVGDDLRKAINDTEIEIDALDIQHDAIVQTR
jgi:hypothetical protein